MSRGVMKSIQKDLNGIVVVGGSSAVNLERGLMMNTGVLEMSMISFVPYR